MAEIKLYGNTVNGDGKYIVSPFDIAAPKSDGITSYVEDDKAANKNIVAYINSQVAKINTSIGSVKTGIASATFKPLTSAPVLKSDSSVSSYISLAVLGKDGSKAEGGFSITLPSANKIVTTASSYTNLVSVVNKLGTSYNTLNSTVATINGTGPDSFRQGDVDTLESAKAYTNEKVSNLGDVYSIKGTKKVAEIKALSYVKKGSVYNVSEAFAIDGKPYPEYTNIVFIEDPQTDKVTWDSAKGFSSTQVDALGGVVNLKPYALIDHTVNKVEVANYDDTFSDTGANTTLGSVNVTTGSTVTTYPIAACLPTTLSKVSNPKLITEANKLKLYGLTNLSGTTVTPLSYKSVSAGITQIAADASNSQQLGISVVGELGSTYESPKISLNKASTVSFGVVKIGEGLNSTYGTISVPKNTFHTTPYLSISSVTNDTHGNDFTLDIFCQTGTIQPSVIPLQKVDESTLGIKIDTISDGYLKLKQQGIGNRWLGIDETKLVSKINSIEGRITALETLLSLA